MPASGTTYVAFLRAINLGSKRQIKMDRLRGIFEDAGFDDVATFIASGNVIFRAPRQAAGTLEGKIEQALEDAVGFEVPTFVRTMIEVEKVAGFDPWPRKPGKSDDLLQVGFLKKTVAKAALGALEELAGDGELVAVRKKDLYWLRPVPMSRSRLGGPALEKALGQPTTIRGIKTLEKILAKHA